MRKKLVAGNWKMHGNRQSVESLIEGIKQGASLLAEKVEIAVFPSFVYLPSIESKLKDSGISWGAQNLYLGAQGAFTGEISGPMLIDYGCRYVLIGHSERRMYFFEDLKLVAAKFKAAIEYKLQPILCVGETLAQREKNETKQVIAEQLDSVIQLAGLEAFKKAVIAYEPVWAIGTGLTASPEQAQEVHAFIRQQLSKHNVDLAKSISILYGGSVKADNAAGLFAMSDIDGGLVGGASLDANTFLSICQAAV